MVFREGVFVSESMSSVLILGGSIRAKKHNESLILEFAEASCIEEYQRAVGEALETNTLCNSEILAGAAAAGARAAGAEVKYHSLCGLFPHKTRRIFEPDFNSDATLAQVDTLDIDKQVLDALLEDLEACQGIVLSTPVYFGDRSSVANKFLQLANVRERVKDKVYGVVSVGAKRNGGQETCNIFSLYEMLHQGTFGVGNGVPTSQYGGTAVGGDLGRVNDDNWGLATAFGTGLKVGQVSRLVSRGLVASRKKRTKIVFLLSMDTQDRKLNQHVQTILKDIVDSEPTSEFVTVNLTEHDIYRCLGCKLCPKDGDVTCAHPQCIIRHEDDYLESARRHLLDADGIIVCGVNPSDIDSLVTRYQVFTERMRSIRRNNYELSNKLFTGLCYHDFGATVNPIHSLKVMVSYIRHNTVMHRPIEVFEYKGKPLQSGVERVREFCRAVSILAAGRRHVELPNAVYNPFGEGGGYNSEHGTQ